MATTSLSLGEHWEVFIKNEIATGRYGSASEVVRDALRHMLMSEGGIDVIGVPRQRMDVLNYFIGQHPWSASRSIMTIFFRDLTASASRIFASCDAKTAARPRKNPRFLIPGVDRKCCITRP
ncbi:putative addiction module antidote protein, CC2985 family [Thiocapsa roseopersicina]|uniref:Antitoxin ParD n=2 Tax=Thiocapsa roseopersicina TaxID=1058 RepID=A0A1H2XVE4_THIRO|nr:type II toxin-antitoxin system ParD family antitoxin [Thiocapsa roseopersicina]SDW96811.1 putative addiction module antidote protein, CC2985 family [Thiocapsa roseopersicina]